jgi:transposase
MNSTKQNFITDKIESLKSIIFGQAIIDPQQKENKMGELCKTYEMQINYMRELVEFFKRRYLGQKSEKLSLHEEVQKRLFNETETAVDSEEKDLKTIQIKGHERKKSCGRKEIPAIIPREEIVHDLSEEEKTHGCGKKMKEIGAEVTEKLRIVPAQITVEKHICKKYACECQGLGTEGKEGAIRQAKIEGQILPKSMATASLLSYIGTGKFCDALPLYRQETMFARLGIDISRQVMSRWFIELHERYSEPIVEIMKEDIKSQTFMGIDETTLQVLSEGERKNQSKSFMWVMRGGEKLKPILLYQYSETRNAQYLKEMLGGYHGWVQSDGLPVYETLEGQSGIVLAGCWAHVRRDFFDSFKTSNEKGHAREALEYIGQLYGIEREAKAKGLNCDEIKDLRQARSKIIIDKFKTWLDQKSVEVAPKSMLGRAIGYTNGQWKKLLVYLEDGRIPIDNNLVENAIRPFVLGRKNWLFSGSPRGAHASAFIYSLIETAKANGLEPYWYLYYLFEKLPYAKKREDYRTLLPYNLDRATLANHFGLQAEPNSS